MQPGSEWQNMMSLINHLASDISAGSSATQVELQEQAQQQMLRQQMFPQAQPMAGFSGTPLLLQPPGLATMPPFQTAAGVAPSGYSDNLMFSPNPTSSSRYIVRSDCLQCCPDMFWLLTFMFVLWVG